MVTINGNRSGNQSGSVRGRPPASMVQTQRPTPATHNASAGRREDVFTLACGCWRLLFSSVSVAIETPIAVSDFARRVGLGGAEELLEAPLMNACVYVFQRGSLHRGQCQHQTQPTFNWLCARVTNLVALSFIMSCTSCPLIHDSRPTGSIHGACHCRCWLVVLFIA